MHSLPAGSCLTLHLGTGQKDIRRYWRFALEPDETIGDADEPRLVEELRALLVDLALNQGYDVICTSGGTGVGPRDISPQVTSAVLDYPLPGFSMAMMQASLAKTPHAAISRAVAGVLGQSIIINLPGSRKAVVENLEAVLPALPHALDKLHGDPADCGG